jgi:hypothetical protein
MVILFPIRSNSSWADLAFADGDASCPAEMPNATRMRRARIRVELVLFG